MTNSSETGQTKGNTLATALAKEVRVVKYGSKINSFKTMAETDKQYQLIEVKEFKESQSKPFVPFSVGGAGIVSGACE